MESQASEQEREFWYDSSEYPVKKGGLIAGLGGEEKGLMNREATIAASYKVQLFF